MPLIHYVQFLFILNFYLCSPQLLLIQTLSSFHPLRLEQMQKVKSRTSSSMSWGWGDSVSWSTFKQCGFYFYSNVLLGRSFKATFSPTLIIICTVRLKYCPVQPCYLEYYSKLNGLYGVISNLGKVTFKVTVSLCYILLAKLSRLFFADASCHAMSWLFLSAVFEDSRL